MNFVAQQSLTIAPGANSEKVSISTSSAPSTLRTDAPYMLIAVDTACFVTVGVGGATPTALATGVHQYLPAGSQYRVPHVAGNIYAFITVTGTGVAYLTPGA